MSTNHDLRRPEQRDARRWMKLIGTNYTQAFRDVGSPLAQGILGDRLTVGGLLEVLDEHPDLGDNGVNAGLNTGVPYLDAEGNIDGRFDSLFSDVAAAAEFLRMFTFDPAAGAPGRARQEEWGIGSYQLKRTAEKFLGSYISNGQLIWAALTLGLPVSVDGEDYDSPNVSIDVPELEHTYVWNLLNRGPRGAHDYRPPRFELLRAALDEYSATGGISGFNAAKKRASVEAAAWRRGDMRFHRWLVSQADRDGNVGRVAADYKYGTEQSEDPIARVPGDLIAILESYNADKVFVENARMAIAEWDALDR
jgi:hypothetical protein